MTYLVNAILEIAKQNPEGFTVEVPSLKPVTGGYESACWETQNCFGRAGLEKVINHALEHGKVVWGWQNTENRKYYFDSSAVFTDRDAAIEFGRKNGQSEMAELYINWQGQIFLRKNFLSFFLFYKKQYYLCSSFQTRFLNWIWCEKRAERRKKDFWKSIWALFFVSENLPIRWQYKEEKVKCSRIAWTWLTSLCTRLRQIPLTRETV